MTSASKFKVRAGKIHLEKFLCQFSFSKSQVTFALKKFSFIHTTSSFRKNKNGILFHDREQIIIFFEMLWKIKKQGKKSKMKKIQLEKWKYSN